MRPLVAGATIAVGLRREFEERALMVDSTCLTVLLASSGGWLWLLGARSSDGVINSVEYGLAYNWVVDVLFMVETPPVFLVSMASILDITKALMYQLLRCWFSSLYKLERGRRLNGRRLDGRRLNCRRLDGRRLNSRRLIVKKKAEVLLKVAHCR